MINRTNKKGYSFRFDPNMIKGVDVIAAATNQNRTQVIEDLITKLLLTNPVTNKPIGQPLDRAI